MIKLDPKKVKTVGNTVLVQFIQDDPQRESKILIVVKQRRRTKSMSKYTGLCIKAPETYVLRSSKNKDAVMMTFDGHELEGQYVLYNPLAILLKFEWEGKEYNLVRVEDIYCALDDYVPDGGQVQRSYDIRDDDMN